MRWHLKLNGATALGNASAILNSNDKNDFFVKYIEDNFCACFSKPDFEIIFEILKKYLTFTFKIRK